MASASKGALLNIHYYYYYSCFYGLSLCIYIHVRTFIHTRVDDIGTKLWLPEIAERERPELNIHKDVLYGTRLLFCISVSAYAKYKYPRAVMSLVFNK